MRWDSATGQYDMGFRNHAPAPFPSETPAAEPTNGATGPARPLLVGAAGSSAFMRELVQHAEGGRVLTGDEGW